MGSKEIKKELSDQQQKILNYMNEYLGTNGYPPTVREICQAVGLSSTSTVHSHLKNLEKLGFIKRDSRPRAIGILAKGSNTQNKSSRNRYSNGSDSGLSDSQRSVSSLPVVGQVAAGTPILAEENIEDYIPMPSSFYSDGDYFMLKVRGDSMKDAGIFDKDYVVVRISNTANNGDIVIALLDDSATVKTFYRETDKIRLQPENQAMSPIYVNDIEIVGIVKGVFRRIN